ncbi:hypothetical protein FOC4_g10007645 [Fusarium odoratissimum]|uniref:Uncharacterized protein n=2 Tax=Fusarium oxysporum f. sp. cubense (strain race 4) TaxID=2502994 RepID=N1RIL2_FUSC4|nr:hypothetical protein FOC4_g10007645 [Fusarium odoratissimum]
MVHNGGDSVIIANKRWTSQIWSSAALDVYSYRFNIVPASIPGVFGASHVQEIPFAFYNHNGIGYNEENMPPWNGTKEAFEDKGADYAEAARLMSSFWVSFVHDQDPNSFGRGGCGIDNRSVPLWPTYTKGGKNGRNFVFSSAFEFYLEPDNFRFNAINLLMSRNEKSYTQE